MGWSKNWPCWRLRSQTFISLSWFMDQWTKRSWNRTSKLSIRQGHPILFQTTTNGQISWRIHRSHENPTKIQCQHECYQGQHYVRINMSHWEWVTECKNKTGIFRWNSMTKQANSMSRLKTPLPRYINFSWMATAVVSHRRPSFKVSL